MTNFVKDFAKVWKLNWFLQARKSDVLFQKKDPYQSEHLSKVVCKFVSASCNASYVGQTCWHLATRIDERFGKDKKYQIYQHLMFFKDFLDKSCKDCFFVLDTANTKHQLRIKESLCITWLKPNLNKQKQCQYITSFSF